METKKLTEETVAASRGSNIHVLVTQDGSDGQDLRRMPEDVLLKNYKPYRIDLSDTDIGLIPAGTDQSYVCQYSFDVPSATVDAIRAAADAKRDILLWLRANNVIYEYRLFPLADQADSNPDYYFEAPTNPLGGSNVNWLRRTTLSVGASRIQMSLVNTFLGNKTWTGTQAQYDALSSYDAKTTYYIVEAQP